MKKKEHTELYHNAESVVDFLPKIKIGIVVANEKLKQTVNTIRKAAPTKHRGDGKILFFSIDDAVHIGTSDSSIDAL